MNKIAPIMSLVDVIMTVSNLWDDSSNSIFLDTSDPDCLACSITFFKQKDRATVGLIYTKEGGAARIFNGQMGVVAQTLEKISQEDFYGVYNMLVQIQKDLPIPSGIDVKEIEKELK